jgi:DNA modification methylase
MNYEEFLSGKAKSVEASGFDIEAAELNPALFDFQRAIVKWALKKGKAAMFLDTGLGKTLQQCEWANRVCEHTGGNVLIAAPLCVSQQTVEEAAKFGIAVRYVRDQSQVEPGISITNYEMLKHFDPSQFVGIVLDESSILKDHTSKTRQMIIDMFSRTPYRLSCTATPSPNDFMELGNQAEFLGVMSSVEMLAMYFVHDGGETSKWRLKGHGKTKFWEWMASWAICIKNPSDLGFDGSRYVLPSLNIHEHVIESAPLDGQLFAGVAQTLSERRQAKRGSLNDRVAKVAEMVNASDEEWIVWCHLNDESSALAKLIPDAVEVYGSLDPDEKERRIMAFTHGNARVLVTKPSISGFGMNWQHCRNQAFVGLDDSFESYYQAVRRCYRFGQEREVNVHLVCSQAEGAVKANLERKQSQADDMTTSMVEHMRTIMQKEIRGTTMEKTEYHHTVKTGNDWTLHHGDCVEVVAGLDSDSIDYTIFSPPFASLYTYSNSDRDMGNCSGDEEFMQHFQFLIGELLRVTKPGRLLSFHCMNLPTTKFRDGYIGIKDFRGDLIRSFCDAGWIYHSEVCIWKDPVTAMQRTKALGLLHKQIKKDSSLSRQGIADYLVTMRKPGENPEPITHTDETFPVGLWQRYASPVWMDINATRTLQYMNARDGDDERHICPLQLDVIERAMELWTNPGDLVLSPFTGIGSEGHVALTTGRRFVGSELKESYFNVACKNLDAATKQPLDIFAAA